MSSLVSLNFENTLPASIYVKVPPTPVKKPELLIWSPETAALLGITADQVRSDDFAQVFAGNKILPGSEPYSTRYAGYQFGHWAGQLGDGRVTVLGELNGQEVQLKGAGLTPFSRRGDGRAVLRSSVREFLCSEAMFYLGVPTTRALCCVLTGDEVVRDMFYDGNPQLEPGAITTRVAPSFLRFGHFEMLADDGNIPALRELADYVIDRFYPEAKAKNEKYVAFFTAVCERTARLMVHWQRVGFVHGVLNTDNMSVLGLTIDYGPYGWLEVYDPDWTPNTTDRDTRRYRFGAQPAVALWNLAKFAEALIPLVNNADDFYTGLERYQTVFSNEYLDMRRNKLGLRTVHENDKQLFAEMDQIFTLAEVDPTIFYRQLTEIHKRREFAVILPAFYQEAVSTDIQQKYMSWIDLYLRRLADENVSSTEAVKLMNVTNPAFILRNYLVQESLDQLAADTDSVHLSALFSALHTPYDVNSATKSYLGRRPEWARQRAGCSDLSCSS